VTIFVALLIFPLIGAATALIFRIPAPRSMVKHAALWFLLGVGMNGAILFIIGRPSIVVAVIALIVVVARRKHFVIAPAAKTPMTPLILAIIPLIVVLCISVVVPLTDYDGRMTWMPKAQAIASEHSIRGSFFRGERGLNLHNHYPLLLPMDVATLMVATGDLDMNHARPFYVLIAIAAVIALHDALGWGVLILAWLPQFLVAHEGGALSAYGDIALMAFVGLAVAAIVTKSPAAGLWLAFAVLTKNEGIVLAMAVVIASRRWSLAIAPAIAMASLIIWRHQVPDAYDERYAVLLRDFDIHRLPAAIAAFFPHAIDFSAWGVFWLAVSIGCLISLSRKQFFLPAFIAIALLVYVGAFAITSWNPAELATVAANRLLLHLVVPALLLFGTSGR
jgi:hypothetical protein